MSEGAAERHERVATALTDDQRDPSHSLCAAAAAVVGVAGAGVVLITRSRTLGNVCTSDAAAEAVEEVQYTLGQGPCVDACRTKRPVLVPDLADGGRTRWPEYYEAARARGFQAVFGFPLMIDAAVCIGALNLYNNERGDLDREQLADAAVAARVAGRVVLGWQSVAGPGSLAWQLEQVPVHRAIVYQAAGMASAQAGVSVEDALVLVRAYAFAEDQPITEVAAAVVERGLRFDPPSTNDS
jgi:hypothetical protein